MISKLRNRSLISLKLLLIAFHGLTPLVTAANCFDEFKTPKLIQTEDETYNDMEAITRNLDSTTIYVGGSIRKDIPSETTAILAAINAQG